VGVRFGGWVCLFFSCQNLGSNLSWQSCHHHPKSCLLSHTSSPKPHILFMSGCPATKPDGSLCGKKLTFPTDGPIVCGNHKHKIDDDGDFDDDLKKAGPQTPQKAELEVVRAVEDDAELMQLASAVVGQTPDLLDVKTQKQKGGPVVIKISFKKPGASPSPAVAQELKAKDLEIERLMKELEEMKLLAAVDE
jgi:hypothetical protein